MPEFTRLGPPDDTDINNLDMSCTYCVWKKSNGMTLLSNDNFAVRASGELIVSRTEPYEFTLTSDDGSSLFINKKRVIDNGGLHPFTSLRVTLILTGGTHAIEIHYFQSSGSAALQLAWNASGFIQVIPNKYLKMIPKSTPNPTTLVPTTAVPTTDVPATSVPPTDIPPVFNSTTVPTTVPVTITSLLSPYPITVVPPTAVPSTPHPMTLIPPTESPNKYILDNNMRTQLTTANNVATLAAIMSMSAVGAGSVARIHLLVSFDCAVENIDLAEEDQLDIETHPTRLSFSFGGNSRQFIVGALVMNPVLLISITVFLFTIAALIKAATRSTWKHVIGSMKLPGIIYIPYLLLLQGTSLVAARAVFYPKGPAVTAVLGGIMMLLCILSPVAIYQLILKKIPSKCLQVQNPRLFVHEALGISSQGFTRELSSKERALYRFAFGDFMWASPSPECKFLACFRIIFQSYKSDTTWFVLCDPIAMVVLSLFSAWQPGNNELLCGTRNVLICFLFFIFSIALLCLRPYGSSLDNVHANSVSTLMLIAVVLITISHWVRHYEEALVVVASWCLFCSVILIIIWCVWDSSSCLVDVWLSRREGNANMKSTLTNAFLMSSQDFENVDLEFQELGDQSKSNMTTTPLKLCMLNNSSNQTHSPRQTFRLVSPLHVSCSPEDLDDIRCSPFSLFNESFMNRSVDSHHNSSILRQSGNTGSIRLRAPLL